MDPRVIRTHPKNEKIYLIQPISKTHRITTQTHQKTPGSEKDLRDAGGA